MRWTGFAILAFLVVIVQNALLPQMGFGGAGPVMVVVLGLFYALYGPAADALVACWILGLLVDLSSMTNVGLNAFGMGCCALAVVGIRGILFKDHWLGQAVLAFLWMLTLDIFNGLAIWWAAKDLSVGWWQKEYLWDALVAAVLALLICRALKYLGGLLIRPRAMR